MDASNPQSSLPQQVKKPISLLISKHTSDYKALCIAFYKKKDRVQKLKDTIPKSIRFNAKLNRSATAEGAFPNEMKTLQDKFSNTLTECTTQLHSYIFQAAELELKALKDQLDQVTTVFNGELTKLSLSAHNCCNESALSQAEFLLLLEGNAPAGASVQHAAVGSTVDSNLGPSIFRFGSSKFIDELRITKSEAAISYAVDDLDKSKKSKSLDKAHQMEVDMPNLEKVGELVDRKITKKFSNMELKMNKIAAALNVQPGRPGKAMNRSKKSPKSAKTDDHDEGGSSKPTPSAKGKLKSAKKSATGANTKRKQAGGSSSSPATSKNSKTTKKVKTSSRN